VGLGYREVCGGLLWFRSCMELVMNFINHLRQGGSLLCAMLYLIQLEL